MPAFLGIMTATRIPRMVASPIFMTKIIAEGAGRDVVKGGFVLWVSVRPVAGGRNPMSRLRNYKSLTGSWIPDPSIIPEKSFEGTLNPFEKKIERSF